MDADVYTNLTLAYKTLGEDLLMSVKHHRTLIELKGQIDQILIETGNHIMCNLQFFFSVSHLF